MLSNDKILAVLLSLSLLLQSCAPSLPKYKNVPKEKIEAPAQFPNQTNKESVSDATPKEDLVKKSWKLLFQDQKLIALIDTALKDNQELNILSQDVNIANNEVMARQGQYLPKVGIGAGYEYEKSSQYSSKGAADAVANLPEKMHNRQASINASWEIDIWKKLRNSAKSSYYEYLASVEGRNFAVTQLVAEVANDYYALMSLDNQHEIVEQFIVNLQQAHEVVELQKFAGRSTSLPVRRFDAEIQQNEGRKYQIEQEIIVTENHLNKLLGRLPQPIERSSKEFRETKIQEFNTNIPADLIDNRPDVKQASLRLEAAKLNVKSVKAEFYPSLNIDANLGYKSFNSGHFIDSPQALFYNIAGGITAPLLNRNAIKADYFSANNKQIQAIYDYEKTFIKAFAEVSNQLAAVENLKHIYKAKSQQVEALSDAFEISNVLFKAARVDYLESLLTRRDYLESQMQLMEAKQQQLSAYVNLYRALGGGWRNEALNLSQIRH
jgi:outer membrane protein, multidrug efflux system